LRSIKPRFQQSYGLRSIGLFGSVARTQRARASQRCGRGGGSGAAKPLFSDWHTQELEEPLRAEVDLVSYRQTMNPYLKRRIDAEAVYV